MSQRKRVALFAGSFDPFTLGHLDVARQALEIFDEIIIGIGVSSTKKPLFSIEERCQVIKSIFADDSRVRVEAFDGLSVTFAKTHQAIALVRGLRTETDFSYEMPMAMTNRKLDASLPTVFLPTKTDFAYISSSIVREVFLHHGDVSPFVPTEVLTLLKAKLSVEKA